MKKLPAATLVALLPLAGFAAADDQAADPAAPLAQTASFEALDTNKDGRISMPEASADPGLVESFATVDKNGDGYLDPTEFANSTRMPPGRN